MHVPIETDLPRHPKTEHLMSVLNIRRHEAVGYLVCLWIWATEFAEDGNLGQFPDKVVSKGAGWRGLGSTFLDALRVTGWMDKDGKLHAWESHFGKCLVANKKAADRMRTLRERSANVTRTTKSCSGGEREEKDIEKEKDNILREQRNAVATEREKKVNPEVKIFIDWYAKSFEDKTGHKMVVNGGKDGALVKRLLGSLGIEELKKRADLLFDSDDEFVKSAGYGINVFASQVNKLTGKKKFAFLDEE